MGSAGQTCYWELQFIVMALKANRILECLCSPLIEKQTPVGERLLSLREVSLPDDFQTFNAMP